LEDFSTITQKNLRAKITHKKYQKQIDWRRNKVRELVIRGYSQYEISNILHISQPTISRDIDFIRNRSSSAAKTKYLGHIYYYELQNGRWHTGTDEKFVVGYRQSKNRSQRKNEGNKISAVLLQYAI